MCCVSVVKDPYAPEGVEARLQSRRGQTHLNRERASPKARCRGGPPFKSKDSEAAPSSLCFFIITDSTRLDRERLSTGIEEVLNATIEQTEAVVVLFQLFELNMGCKGVESRKRCRLSGLDEGATRSRSARDADVTRFALRQMLRVVSFCVVLQ